MSSSWSFEDSIPVRAHQPGRACVGGSGVRRDFHGWQRIVCCGNHLSPSLQSAPDDASPVIVPVTCGYESGQRTPSGWPSRCRGRRTRRGGCPAAAVQHAHTILGAIGKQPVEVGLPILIGKEGLLALVARYVTWCATPGNTSRARLGISYILWPDAPIPLSRKGALCSCRRFDSRVGRAR